MEMQGGDGNTNKNISEGLSGAMSDPKFPKQGGVSGLASHEHLPAPALPPMSTTMMGISFPGNQSKPLPQGQSQALSKPLQSTLPGLQASNIASPLPGVKPVMHSGGLAAGGNLPQTSSQPLPGSLLLGSHALPQASIGTSLLASQSGPLQTPLQPLAQVVQTANSGLQTAALQSQGLSTLKPITTTQTNTSATSALNLSMPQPSVQLPAQTSQSLNSTISMSAGPNFHVRVSQGNSKSQNEQKKQLKETDALDYLNQVKKQFGDNPEIYNKFLDIMKDFKSHAIDTQRVIERVSKLFHGHQSLILGFNTFLPAGYKIEVRPAPAQQPPVVQPPKKLATPAAQNKKAAPEFDHAYSYVSKIKARFANQPNVYQQFLQILQRYKDEGYAIAQVKEQVAELFAGHEDLLGEFGNFLPDPSANKPSGVSGAAMPSKAMKKPKPSATQPGQLSASHPTQQSANMMGQFTAGVSTLANQSSASNNQAQGQNDSSQSATNSSTAKSSNKKPAEKKPEPMPENTKEAALLEKIKKKLSTQAPNCYTDFLKCLSLYVQDVLTANELITLLEDLMGGPGFRECFEELKHYLGIRDGPNNKYKTNVPISEIDFSNCASMGTSYKCLPADYPLPTCAGRTELCDEVLNDEWVSVPSGSEDYSFTHYRKNQYEESLFKCEDDRFELDMLIETNASAIRAMEPLLEECDKDRSRSAKINISSLKAIHYKAIERVYGDHGQEITEHVKRAPRVALSVVLPRLKQKDEEWRKARRDMNRIWREVYKDNYYKSLDHRSFYFKQIDKKGLSAKSFLGEIKQSQEVGSSKEESPYLVFSLGRKDIHQDILEVVGKSAANKLMEGAEARVRKFFHIFLHVFLGLKKRCIDDVRARARMTTKKERKSDQDKDKDFLNLRNRSLSKEDEEAKDEDEEMKEMNDDEKESTETKTVGDDTDEGEEVAKTNREQVEKVKDAEDEDEEEETEEESEDEDHDIWQSVHSLSTEFLPLKTYAEEKNGQVDDIMFSSYPKAQSGVHVFYGNLSCYVFFRLYQKLYERLLKAKNLANEMSKREEEVEINRDQEPKSGSQTAETDAPCAEQEGSKSAEAIYKKFMNMLIQLVEEAIDTSKFEDDCRMLLGTNSYELYTLEKVVEKLLGQVQSITSESSTQTGARHLALMEYECLRTDAENWEDISPLDYLGNASCLSGEEGCFAFFYSTKDEKLTIALLDVKEGGKADTRNERKREDWIDDLLSTIADSDAVDKRPFLTRSLNKCLDKYGKEEEKFVRIGCMEIKCSDSRVSFGPMTNECQYRRKFSRDASYYSTSRRAKKVAAWQEERLKKIPEEAAAEAARLAELEAAQRAEEEEEDDENEEDEEQETGEREDEEGEGEGDAENEAEAEEEGGLDQLVKAGQHESAVSKAASEAQEEEKSEPMEDVTSEKNDKEEAGEEAKPASKRPSKTKRAEESKESKESKRAKRETKEASNDEDPANAQEESKEEEEEKEDAVKKDKAGKDDSSESKSSKESKEASAARASRSSRRRR